MDFRDFQIGTKEMSFGTPLTTAAIRGRNALVGKLVELRANPDSKYGFVAGAEQKVWSGSALHACVNSGNLELLELLMELDADVNSKGSNGASLLWQSGYFGKPHITQFLLKMKHDP